jgi:hypothetical protein
MGKRVIQEHHIKYKKKDGYDWTVIVYKGEHQILGLIKRYTKKNVSQGFSDALINFVLENQKRARKLKK